MTTAEDQRDAVVGADLDCLVISDHVVLQLMALDSLSHYGIVVLTWNLAERENFVSDPNWTAVLHEVGPALDLRSRIRDADVQALFGRRDG